jgi:hypothetical protein
MISTHAFRSVDRTVASQFFPSFRPTLIGAAPPDGVDVHPASDLSGERNPADQTSTTRDAGADQAPHTRTNELREW